MNGKSSDTSSSKNTNPISTIATAVFTLIVIGFAAVILFTGKVTVKLNDKSITSDASRISGTTIEYKDIQEVFLETDFDKGVRTNGIGSPKLQAGSFKNDDFGSYKLYSYTKNNLYVLVKHTDGTLVFNLENAYETKNMYEKLCKMTGQMK